MRVLVLRFSSLGDVALCLPALKSVLAQNPSLEITFVTRKAFAPLFQDLARTQIEFLQPDSEHKGLPGLYRLFKELKSK
jgi:ADP-heptose:LPS heptosyltransferase